MLLCSDGTFYVGVTNSLERRIAEHQSGVDPKSYTHQRRPVELVWSDSFTQVGDAIAAEKQIKPWSKSKKRALINGDFERLSLLAKKKF